MCHSEGISKLKGQEGKRRGRTENGKSVKGQSRIIPRGTNACVRRQKERKVRHTEQRKGKVRNKVVGEN